MDPHGGSDLLGGDGNSFILEQLLECEDWSEDPSVHHGAGPVKYTGLSGTSLADFYLFQDFILGNFVYF